MMLELFCFRLIMKSNSLQGNDILNSSNAIAGVFYEKQNQVVRFFQLGRINKDLIAENVKLKNELDAFHYFDTSQDITARVPVVVYDTITPKPVDTVLTSLDSAAGKSVMVQELKPYSVPRVVKYASYSYVAARVVNNNVVNDRNNYITINKGLKDGIKVGMPVVTAEGVVGRVAYVSNYYAAIISVLSSRPISSQIAGGNVGVSSWDGKSPDYIALAKLDVRTNLKKGDTAYTTSYSDFPENIAIGKVVKVDTYKVNNTLNVKLKLANNFRNLQNVYIVVNKLGTEKQDLEEYVNEKEKAAQKQNRP